MAKAQTWLQKYVPKTGKDIIGQDGAIKQLREFLTSFKQQRKKAVILHGASGCGKTASAYALANELDLEVLELNASDFRTADAINSILGNASKQMSLFGKGKLILVEEIDGISGTKDRGGIPAIEKLSKETAFPIVMTANNPFDKKYSKLRKISTLIGFEPLDYISAFSILEKIAREEGIDFEEHALKSLARRSGGDLRAAINDFQILTAGGRKITMDVLDDLSPREQEESIINALTRVFKTTDYKVAINAFDQVPEDLDKILLWLDENIPYEYTKPADLARAYDSLSKADIMRRRIRRWQHWRFLIYVNAHLSAGVATSKDAKYAKPANYKQTTRLLKIWQANMKYAQRKAISEKIAAKTHSSTKYTTKHVFPYIRHIFLKNPHMADQMAAEFKLSKDEISYMTQ